MDHVVGRVFMLSKSQSGSRFVQENLSDPVFFDVFFNELKTRVAELMMDNFGHYAIEGVNISFLCVRLRVPCHHHV